MNDGLEFARVVDQFYGALYRFGLSLTGSEPDACDLVQQTFYLWARKGGQLANAGRVKSWLFTTLYRQFLQSRRRAQRFPHLELGTVEQELPESNATGGDRVDGHHVVAMLQSLEEPFRAAVSLFYLEDYTYDEIAVILDLPLGTVKSRLSRGIARLRELFARDLASGEAGEADLP
jgi:RNA polymerase sigma-70 factor (ECF subfamily)